VKFKEAEIMERKFLNYRNVKCKSNCLYCFAHWPIDDTNFDKLRDFDEDVIIYPFCNDDIIDSDSTDNIIQYLEKCLIIQSKKAIVSISTKSNVPEVFLEKIEQINKEHDDHGFIKLSVSFSCKKESNVIEPNAASYKNRLELLRKIADHNIPTSAILKPILPFIELTEYYEIVRDVSAYTNTITIGSLYVNDDTSFYNDYIKGRYTTTKKQVKWLKNLPLWKVIESSAKVSKLQDYINKNNMKCFESDAEYINSLIKVL
jgi:DNA repair photolyase